MDIRLRAMTDSEQKYAYSQSQQLTMQCGSIGYLRGDFDNSGDGFFTTWNDKNTRLKTEEFQTEFDEVINALRSDEQFGSFLKSRHAMSKYCYEHKESAFNGSYCTEYAFRADTEKYAYLIRCNPTKGDYNFYVYPYMKEWLDRNIKKAEKGIRFIDSGYKELFRLKDGDSITITTIDNEKKNAVCRYVDETHTEVGNELYHICQFAEEMQHHGAVFAPKDRLGNTYEIYQIDYVRHVDYAFRSLEEAGNSFNRSDYKLMYAGMLAADVTLEQIWDKHNRDSRPFGQQMRSLSLSDVVVLNRNGSKKAFYADRFGFAEVPQFLTDKEIEDVWSHYTPVKKDLALAMYDKGHQIYIDYDLAKNREEIEKSAEDGLKSPDVQVDKYFSRTNKPKEKDHER